MKYKGKEIIEPTITQIREYIKLKHMQIDPREAYKYWVKKNWLTNKGTEARSLEAAINAYNGVVMSTSKSKVKKHKKTLVKTSIKKNEPSEIESYSEQLRDKRWKAFRKFIIDVRGDRCEMCGYNKGLQVHHPKYRKGAKAWEYNCNEVIVLCGNCHMRVHGITKKDINYD